MLILGVVGSSWGFVPATCAIQPPPVSLHHLLQALPFLSRGGAMARLSIYSLH